MFYLTFTIASQYFSIDSSQVVFVRDSLPVTRLPMVPSYIDGVINIDGEVLAQVNMANLLELDSDLDQGKVIVVDINDGKLAISVDVINDRVEVDDIYSFSDIDGTSLRMNQYSDYFLGEIYVAGKSFFVIDPLSLIDIVQPSHRPPVNGFLAKTRVDKAIKKDLVSSYLCFRIATESYVIPLFDVLEVIENETFIPVPGGHGCFKGLVRLRGEPLLVLDAAKVFGCADTLDEYAKRIFVVSYNNKRLGFLVDEIFSVSTYSASQLKNTLQDESPLGAYIVNATEGVHILIDLNKIISNDLCIVINKYLPREVVNTEKKSVVLRSFLEINLNDNIYVVPLENVVRISDVVHETYIEDSCQALVGSVSLEGEILPLIDLSLKVNAETVTVTNKLLVIESDDSHWALRISAVNKLFSVDINQLDRSNSSNGMLQGILNVEGKLLNVLDFYWLGCLQTEMEMD